MRRIPNLLLLLVAALASGCSDLLSDGYDYGSVDVEVVGRSGDPAAGVRLVLYTWSHHLAYGETGADGRHTFDFVPTGDFGVRAVPEEPYLTFSGEASVSRDGIRIDEKGREEVSFTLLRRGPGAVAVRVRQPDGEAVAGVHVELYAPSGGVAEGTTNAAGELEFESVPFGGYGVRIEAPLGFTAAPGRGGTYHDGIFVDAGSREVFDFSVERCTGSIRVRVVGPSGQPVGGVRVAIYTFRGTVAEGISDADGTVEFADAPCGSLGAALQADLGYDFEPGRGSSFVDGIEVRNGSEHEISFAVAACTGSLRVLVTDGAGAAIAGAGLVLYGVRGEIDEGETGADGSFAFEPAPCGDLGVRVVPPSGFTVEEGTGSSYFDGLRVRGGGEPTTVAFVLSRS